MKYISDRADFRKKHSIELRFRNVSVVLFTAIFAVLALAVSIIIGNITNMVSKDYARFYSVETVEKFYAYLNREVGLVTKVAKSDALIDWFADEYNPDKKMAAYREMISYADMLYSAHLYFVINDSLDEYAIDKVAEFEDVKPVDKVARGVEYDRWYFECIDSDDDYKLNIDIDKITNQRRLWINYKVMRDGELLGVFCSGLSFDEVFDHLFEHHEKGKLRGVVVNADGFIQMDSDFADERDFSAFDERLLIWDVNADKGFASVMEEYLGKIDGYFVLNDKPVITELKKGEYHYMSIAPITGTDWSVVTFFNSGLLFGAGKLLPLMFVGIVAMFVFAFVMTLLCRSLIFIPFRKLTGSLNSANAGEPIYGQELQNEFGEIARTIQHMNERLAAKNEELVEAIEKSESANKAKSRFIANMSHEMRTPMNVIVGLTDLILEEEDVPDNIRETFKKINTAGNSLMGLINDVLDISKIESGKLELSPIQFDTASL
ncbi:MAG: hypothetical protein FWF82_04310, partial [Oscillospiraceae bacterium]|nr:hypothetical protein [Oscillospiraceae bacterium]